MVKKNYNPFKMWGSYVGAIVSLLAIHIIPNHFVMYYLAPIVSHQPFYYFVETLSYLRTLAFGFLIGWGIHCLFRRFK